MLKGTSSSSWRILAWCVACCAGTMHLPVKAVHDVGYLCTQRNTGPLSVLETEHVSTCAGLLSWAVWLWEWRSQSNTEEDVPKNIILPWTCFPGSFFFLTILFLRLRVSLTFLGWPRSHSQVHVDHANLLSQSPKRLGFPGALSLDNQSRLADLA